MSETYKKILDFFDYLYNREQSENIDVQQAECEIRNKYLELFGDCIKSLKE